jgi:transposase
VGRLAGPSRTRHSRVRPQACGLADRLLAAGLRPELNPAEGIWAYLKTGALANLAALGLDHLIQVTKTALKRSQYRPDLLRGFLAETKLVLEPLQLVTPRVQPQ